MSGPQIRRLGADCIYQVAAMLQCSIVAVAMFVDARSDGIYRKFMQTTPYRQEMNSAGRDNVIASAICPSH